MVPRTSHYVASNELRSATCYDNLKFDETVTIQSICMVAPTLGPNYEFALLFSFCTIIPTISKNVCTGAPILFANQEAGAMVQNENRGKTYS